MDFKWLLVALLVLSGLLVYYHDELPSMGGPSAGDLDHLEDKPAARSESSTEHEAAK